MLNFRISSITIYPLIFTSMENLAGHSAIIKLAAPLLLLHVFLLRFVVPFLLTLIKAI